MNLVTPALFARYPDARAMARATSEELEPQILSTGFFRQKAKSLIGMAKALVAEHGGAVPADMDKLTALPGVGRKTANVVLGHALGVPGLPVDRHVLRVSNRIGIAEGDDPVQVEAQLCGALPKEKWTLASDVQILHGRRVCRPKPLCDICSVRDDCDYYRLVVGPAKAGPIKPKKRPAKAGPYETKKRPANGGPYGNKEPDANKKPGVNRKQPVAATNRKQQPPDTERDVGAGLSRPRKHDAPRVRKARR